MPAYFNELVKCSDSIYWGILEENVVAVNNIDWGIMKNAVVNNSVKDLENDAGI